MATSVAAATAPYTCASAELAQGQSSWRLPNVKELASLTVRRCGNSDIDSEAFPNTPDTWYRTSVPYEGNGYYAWVVNFNGGGVSYQGRSNVNAVRLVRASLAN